MVRRTGLTSTTTWTVTRIMDNVERPNNHSTITGPCTTTDLDMDLEDQGAWSVVGKKKRALSPHEAPYSPPTTRRHVDDGGEESVPRPPPPPPQPCPSPSPHCLAMPTPQAPPTSQLPTTATARPAASAAPAAPPVPGHPAPPAHSPPAPFPRYRTSPAEGQTHYGVVREVNRTFPNHAITVRLENRGSWTVTPKDLEAYQALQDSTLQLVEINEARTERWAVLLRFPLYHSLDLLTDLPFITAAQRCVGRDKSPTSQVKITCLGKVPESITLGIFGTFQVRPWSPEPLRCYRCHRFGHHQKICQGRETCGVCAGSHPTRECTEKHRRGVTTLARCPNCSGKHHAWNQGCPERRRRIPARHTTPARGARQTHQGPTSRRPPSRSRSRPRTSRTRNSVSRSGSRPRVASSTGAVPKTTPRQITSPPPPPSQQGWVQGVTVAEVHQAPAGGPWPDLPAPQVSYRDAVVAPPRAQRPPRKQRVHTPAKPVVAPAHAPQKPPPASSTRCPPPPVRRPVLAAPADQDIRPATPPSTPVADQYSQLEARMLERQSQLERQMDHYATSINTMTQQMTSLKQQLLDMLQAQFSKLAAAITTTLHLPQDQATILQDLVNEHLHQLAVTAQLRLPKGTYALGHTPPSPAATPVSSEGPPHHNTRDPRLAPASTRLGN